MGWQDGGTGSPVSDRGDRLLSSFSLILNDDVRQAKRVGGKNNHARVWCATQERRRMTQMYSLSAENISNKSVFAGHERREKRVLFTSMSLKHYVKRYKQQR